ncbi:MAG TPA: 16S rRNA (guanine(966)-N(2))-methyltransferase RsmD, partial [Terriglobia bacterium]|nr:16S rRNA (guanine(966)-N(2))-methyltransferase RsmD [Terriglobia bacterium]
LASCACPGGAIGSHNMRIISGKFKSRQLKGTPPAGLRPTSDKLRETLFNILGPSVAGSDFLDACAGMGGVGIEAISRGAQSVCFVDTSRKATAIIRENLAALKIEGGFRILEAELRKAFDVFEGNTAFDIAFLDPPYDREDLYTMALETFGSRALLKDEGILVMEHSKRQGPPAAAGFLRRYRLLTQGDSCLSFYRKDT